MGNRRNFGSLHLEKVQSKPALASWAAHAFLFADWSDQEHIRAFRAMIEIEIFAGALVQDRRSERPERFAELDFEIHDRLHRLAAGIADDASTAERAGAEFHPSLEQADDFLCADQIRHAFLDHAVVVAMIGGADAIQICVDLPVCEPRAEARTLLRVSRIDDAPIFEQLMPYEQCGAQRSACVTGGGLNPQSVERALA